MTIFAYQLRLSVDNVNKITLYVDQKIIMVSRHRSYSLFSGKDKNV